MTASENVRAGAEAPRRSWSSYPLKLADRVAGRFTES